MCGPSTWPEAAASCSAVYVFGDEHTRNSAPSSEHWRTAAGSSTVNVKVAVCSFVVSSAPDTSVGPPVISTTGGVRSPISQS